MLIHLSLSRYRNCCSADVIKEILIFFFFVRGMKTPYKMGSGFPNADFFFILNEFAKDCSRKEKEFLRNCVSCT